MHTITSLRKALGLSTTNQVRNRIDAVKDVLADHLRRGPNNQILLTDEGLQLLRKLQELYDSGLTMAEASDVLRAKAYKETAMEHPVSSPSARNRATPDETGLLAKTLREELAFLRERIAFLESELRTRETEMTPGSTSWWERLREDTDAS